MHGTYEFFCPAAPAHAFRDGQFFQRLLDTRTDEDFCRGTRYHRTVDQPLALVGTQGLEFDHPNAAGARKARRRRGGLPTVIVGGGEGRSPPLAGLISTLSGYLADPHRKSSWTCKTRCLGLIGKAGFRQGLCHPLGECLTELSECRRGQLFGTEFNEEVRPAHDDPPRGKPSASRVSK